jgi:mRNA interferase MazF
VGRLIAQRGEIWLIDLGLIQKVRPVLILSRHYKDQERTLVSYVVRTTSKRGTEYEVPHSALKFLEGVFDAQSISTVPDVQLIRRLTVCDPDTLAKVESALQRWLGLRKD